MLRPRNNLGEFRSGLKVALLATALVRYLVDMSVRCLFRLHRPMLTSIVRRENGFAALCNDCGLPIERSDVGRWSASEALLSRRDQAA